MAEDKDEALVVVSDKMNKAEGVIEGIEVIVDFEEVYNKILNGRQEMADRIVKDSSKTNEVPENIVAEIEKERGKKTTDDSRTKGKVAEVEDGLKRLMEQGKKPSHAIIEDDKFEIFGKSNNDDDELDR